MARGAPRSNDEAVRITTAPSKRSEEIATRQRRYLISMSLRTICFVAAIVTALAGIGWLWPIFIAGALILPYIAVVMANAAAPRQDGFELPDGRYDLHELPAAPDTRHGPDARP